MERGNSQQQTNRVSSNMKSCLDYDYIEGHSEVSFGTPSLKASPFNSRNITKQKKSEAAKRWKIKWNSNVKNERRQKSTLRRWKEKWTVKLKTSYGGGMAVLLKKEIHNKIQQKYSTKKQMSPPQLRPITDQEISDGLPDVFDFET